MIYGYARVSTNKQLDGNSLEEQCRQLRDNGCQLIFSEQYTGAKMNRPEFEKLMEVVQEGDTLVVTKLDRFARNATDGYITIKNLMDRGVSVNVLNMGVANDTAMGRLMLQILFAFSEFEREMIKERTQAGIRKAREDGVKFGRKGLTPEIVAEIQKGTHWKKLGISKATWYKYRRS